MSLSPDRRHDVFLSHRSSDKPAIEALAARLMAEGIIPWIDSWNLIPGEAWQPEIEAALEGCDACAVFVGQDPLGPWQHAEMRAAIARQISQPRRRLRVIPVLLPGAGDPKDDRLPPFLAGNTWVDFRNSLDDAAAFHRLVCGIRGVSPGPGIRL